MWLEEWLGKTKKKVVLEQGKDPDGPNKEGFGNGGRLALIVALIAVPGQVKLPN